MAELGFKSTQPGVRVPAPDPVGSVASVDISDGHIKNQREEVNRETKDYPKHKDEQK